MKKLTSIITDIYFYIIGINLFLIVAYEILFKIINFKESLTITIVLTLISAVAIIFAIKWGVERTLKKNTIHPKEFLKITIFIILVPIILDALASGWIIYINLGNFSNVAWYLVPRLLFQFIVAFITGIFYGIVAYFWLRKLSK